MFLRVYIKLLYTFSTNEQICIFLGKSNTFLVRISTTDCTESHIFHSIFTAKVQYQISVFNEVFLEGAPSFYHGWCHSRFLFTRVLSVFLRSFLSTNNLCSITSRLFIAGFITRIVFLFSF